MQLPIQPHKTSFSRSVGKLDIFRILRQNGLAYFGRKILLLVCVPSINSISVHQWNVVDCLNNGVMLVQSRESLLKGRNQYNWPPSIN